MKSLAALLMVQVLGYGVSAQPNSVISNPDALIDLVMFADAPGVRDTVLLKNYSGKLDWRKMDDWNFTSQHEDYELFTYRVLHSKKAIKTIATFESTTGTGQFAKLLQIEVTDSSYHFVKLIAGGDRCNGATVANSYKLKGKTLTYDVLLTPQGMMNILEGLPLTDYFSDCMTCCSGKARYKFNLATGKEEFIHVQLTDTFEIADQFDAVYMEYLNEGKQVLDSKEFTEFAKTILLQIVEDNTRK